MIIVEIRMIKTSGQRVRSETTGEEHTGDFERTASKNGGAQFIKIL